MSSDGAEWVSTRLFRNVLGLSYRSRIHEYLAHPGTAAVNRRIRISNYPNKKGKETSSDRNIRLCAVALAEDPSNSRLHHYLGNEFRNRRNFPKAIRHYEKALELDNFEVGKYHTSYYLGVCYLLQEEWEHAIAAAIACLSIDPRYAEAPCLLGDIYSSMGNRLFAEQWYEAALQKKPPEDAVMAVQYWSYRDHPLERLRKLRRK